MAPLATSRCRKRGHPHHQWRNNGSLGQDRVDPVGHSFEHVLQELPRRLSVSRCHELGDGELGGLVNADKEEELALGRLHFGYVDVKWGTSLPPVRGPCPTPMG